MKSKMIPKINICFDHEFIEVYYDTNKQYTAYPNGGDLNDLDEFLVYLEPSIDTEFADYIATKSGIASKIRKKQPLERGTANAWMSWPFYDWHSFALPS